MGDRDIIRVSGDAVVMQDASVRSNPALVYLGSLTPVGRRSMASALLRVARLCGVGSVEAMPWAGLRFEHVQAIRTDLLSQGYKAPTVNQTLAGIRGTMLSAWIMGQIDAEHYQRIKTVKLATGSGLPTGRAISAGELWALLRVCTSDTTDAGVRDAAIIALGYGAGLRRAELAALTLASLDDDDQETIIIKLIGKRNKERLVYLDNGSVAALRDWLKARGAEPGPLFYAARRGGHLLAGHGMTPQAIRDVVIRRAAQAGVKNVTPHDLRRSFVSDLLDAGADIATVAAMAGHENVTTTQRYDRRGEHVKKRAARLLHVPYRAAG